MAKLTLSVDPRVIRRAKKYARSAGVSVSWMVEQYLDRVPEADPALDEPPVLRSLRGSLKGVRPSSYGRHLAEKYL